MSNQVAATAAVSDVKPTGVRWNIFFLMLFLISINYIDRASLSVAMPLISKEFDVDPAMQGLILSSFFWTYAFMQVPGGMLADRFKPRIVIALATLGWGFFQAIAALATNWVVLLLTRLGLGASEAGGVSKLTAAARMLCANERPSSSSMTLPTKAARAPRLAMMRATFPAPPILVSERCTAMTGVGASGEIRDTSP